MHRCVTLLTFIVVAACVAPVQMRASLHQIFTSGLAFGTPLSGEPVVHNGRWAFFAAADDEHGTELWIFDTVELTSRVALDIYAGKESSYPGGMRDFGGCVLLSAQTDALGRELYVADSNIAVLHTDIEPATGVGSNPHGFVLAGTEAWFFCSAGICRATCVPGSASVAVPASAFGMGNLTELTGCGTMVVWSAYTAAAGQELWYFNAAPGPIIPAELDIYGGAAGSEPKGFACAADGVYFDAYTPTHGSALYRLTPTGVLTMIAAPHGPSDVNGTNVTTRFGPQWIGRFDSSSHNGVLYAGHREGTGYELFRYMPTRSDPVGGTGVYLSDINAGGDGSYPSGFTTVDVWGYSIMAATSRDHYGRQLWGTDGRPDVITVTPQSNITYTRNCILYTSINVTEDCSSSSSVTDTADWYRINVTTAANLTNSSLPSNFYNLSYLCYEPRYTRTQTVNVTTYNNTIDVTRTVDTVVDGVVTGSVNTTITETFTYNVTSYYTVTTDHNIGNYPCHVRYDETGQSAKNIDPVSKIANTWLVCELATSSSNPSIHGKTSGLVLSPQGAYIIRHSDDGGNYTFSMLDPRLRWNERPLSTPNNPTRGGFGDCYPGADILGLNARDVQTPAFAHTSNSFVFLGRARDAAATTGIWTLQMADLYTQTGACSVVGHERNVCGICALPGDDIKCRGLSCDRLSPLAEGGPFPASEPPPIHDGCGRCIRASEALARRLGFRDQCECHFDPSYTAATQGFGVVAFNTIETAVYRCRTRRLVVHADIGAGTVLDLSLARGMRITAPDGQSLRPLIFRSLSAPGASGGFALEGVDVRSDSCVSGAVVNIDLASGTLKVFDSIILSTMCSMCISATIGADATANATLFVTDAIFDGCGVTAFFSPADSVRWGRHVNYTRVSVAQAASTALDVTGASSVWINNVYATAAHGLHLIRIIAADATLQREWIHVARVFSQATAVTSHAIWISGAVRSDVYGNVIAGTVGGYGIFLDSWVPMGTRGPPDDLMPWEQVRATDALAAARFVAYHNHRARPVRIVTVSPTAFAADCTDLCGMDERDNFAFEYELSPVTIAAGALKTTMKTSIRHLEQSWILPAGTSVVQKQLVPSPVSTPLAGIVVGGSTQQHCNTPASSRAYTCEHTYDLSVPYPPGTREVFGDFRPLLSVDVHDRARIQFNPRQAIRIEHYDSPELAYRVRGATARLFMDASLSDEYSPLAHIEDGSQVFVSIDLDNFQPLLAGDNTGTFTVEIVRIAACFPRAYYVDAPFRQFGLKYPDRPVTPFVPWRPHDTGCWDSMLPITGPFVLYDTDEPPEYAAAIDAAVVANPLAPPTRAVIQLTMRAIQDTPEDIWGELTVVYRVRRALLLDEVYYQFNSTASVNATYVNQVQFRRRCADPAHGFIDPEDDGLWVCGEKPRTPKLTETSPVLYFVLAGVVFLAIGSACFYLAQSARVSK